MYRTNWGIGHSIKDILEAHKGPFTGQGHKGLYEILTTSWHAQLSINLAMLGSLTIVVAHPIYFFGKRYDPTIRYNDLLDRVLRHRDAIISHLNWASSDMFSDTGYTITTGLCSMDTKYPCFSTRHNSPRCNNKYQFDLGGDNLVAVGRQMFGVGCSISDQGIVIIITGGEILRRVPLPLMGGSVILMGTGIPAGVVIGKNLLNPCLGS
ncbi:hypothetical protein JHK87_051870 [Glycine soja]|nr:hypothetical protein JHK87_051870 [Glycine soja]